MLFEWDKKKNETNFKKHGIKFEEAKTIFHGQVLTIEDSKKDYGEARKISIGESESGIAVLVIIHTGRKEAIRIISARKANKKERKLYHEHFKKKG